MTKHKARGLLKMGIALALLSVVSTQSIQASKSLVCASLDPLSFFYDSTKYECEACPQNQVSDLESK